MVRLPAGHHTGLYLPLLLSMFPHGCRPNPIGLSLVKLAKIEGRCVWITGHDLLDGTPILDIKPYLPYVEALPDASCPAWALRENDLKMGDVTFSEAALEQLGCLCAGSEGSQTPDEVRQAMEQLLGWDIRNLKQRQAADPASVYILRYAGLQASYTVDPKTLDVTVFQVEKHGK